MESGREGGERMKERGEKHGGKLRGKDEKRST